MFHFFKLCDGRGISCYSFIMRNMTSNVEYRSVIKFLILGQTESSSIIEQLQEAYGDVCPLRATIYNWIREFRHGRQPVFDADREGRPIEISAEKHVLCEKIIVSERRISIRERAQSLHISRGSTETILKDRGIRKLCSRFGFFKTTRQFTPPTRPQAHFGPVWLPNVATSAIQPRPGSK